MTVQQRSGEGRSPGPALRPSPEHIHYVDATVEDGPELDAMARVCWIDTFEHSCSAEDMALYLGKAYGPGGALLRDLADQTHRFRLAKADGRIIGYAKLSEPWLPEGSFGLRAKQLSQLYIAKDWQGAGIAQTLMDWTIAAAREAGADELLLTVWEENHRAMRFYGRYGFDHVGDYAFQTGSQVDRDLIYRLAL
jgi:GNAT superfamily N-acetyltransferase